MHRLESEREHKDSLVKTIARYSSSNIYRRLLGILNVLIKPKLLSPELYGLWNLINVIPRYAAYFHLGTHETIRYAIPYHEARNETEINADIIGSVYYGTFFLYCFVALGVFLFAILRDLTLQVRIGLLTMSVVIILLGYVNYYTCLLKAYQKFKIITTANYIYATISVFSGLILIYFFSIYGAYLTLVLCEIAAILYLRGKMPLPKHNKFKMHVFIPLVKKGFFIIAFGLCITLTRTCDRFIISYFLGYEQLGYYAIALMVLNSFMLIPGASREVLEPRLMQDINSIGNQEIIEDYLLRPLTNAAFYMPIMIGAAYFILPSLIKWILPRYISGIVPMQILVCGGYFLAMSYLVRGFVIAKKWHISVLLPLVSVLIVNVVIIIVFVKVSGQITGAAIGAGISNFILFVSLLIFIIRKCDTNDTKNLRKGIIPIIFPFIGMCIGFFILNYCFSFISINAFIEGIIKFLIFLFSLLIIIFIVERKYSYLDGFNINQLLKKKNIEPIKKHDNDNKEELGIFYE